jgi:tetratricopeptide (TPR) repeat protein
MDDVEVIYELKHFETLLIALLTSLQTALHLQHLLQKNQLANTYTAYVMLHIAQITNNEVLWLQTAEAFAHDEPAICLQLLDKYRGKGKREDLIRVARHALEINPVLFDEYIITHLKPQEDRELYVHALSGYTRRGRSIGHYQMPREYYTPDERMDFMTSYANGYDHLFYVLLLETEGRYQDILIYIKQFKNREVANFNKMLASVALHFPNECMDLVMDKSEYALQSDRRGRHTYREITSWLKVLKVIPALEEQLRVFSNHLYDHNARLRALREELQYAGLVRKK